MPGRYPYEPGHKGQPTGISAAKFASGFAGTLESLSLRSLESGPKTPEEACAWIAGQLGRPVLLTSIRPRFSAAKAKGLVKDSGERGLGEGGRCKSIRWALTSAEERALFAARKAAEEEKNGGDDGRP